MYDNVGGKIKFTAQLSFLLEVIAGIIVGIVFFEDTDGLSLLYISLASIPAAYFLSMLLYGFGEIIDKLVEIERNTHSGTRKSEAKTRAENERISKIERLRTQGLITEEEYQQAISKEQ